MNYFVNMLLVVAFAMVIVGLASDIGEGFETMTYVTACALAVLSLVVAVRTASAGSVGNEGASRIGADK